MGVVRCIDRVSISKRWAGVVVMCFDNLAPVLVVHLCSPCSGSLWNDAHRRQVLTPVLIGWKSGEYCPVAIGGAVVFPLATHSERPRPFPF